MRLPDLTSYPEPPCNFHLDKQTKKKNHDNNNNSNNNNDNNNTEHGNRCRRRILLVGRNEKKKETHTPVSRVGRPNKSYDLPNRFCYTCIRIILYYYNRRRSGCDPRHVPRRRRSVLVIYFLSEFNFLKKKNKNCLYLKMRLVSVYCSTHKYYMYKACTGNWRKRQCTVINHVFVCILKYLYAIKIPPDGV